MEVKFKPELFWDVDLKKLNPIIHKTFIIKRILQYGNLDDWHWLIKFYGKSQIRQVLKKSRKAEFRPSILKLTLIIFR